MARQIEANEKKQKILGILGPALSGLGTVVGIALAAFTAGASLGLIIAMSIVGSALTAYSIVDSQLGLTQSAVAALNDYLLEEFPGDDNVLARAGVKAAIISAIAVPLAIAFVASGGGAAVNVATQTATMVAKEAALQAIRQASMQLLLLTIMSSNAIPDLMMGSLIQSGAIDKDDEKAKFITQIICMIVVMGITMYGATNLSRASTAAKPAVPPPPTVPKPVIAPPIAAAPTVVVAKTASERLSLLIDKILAALAKAAEKAGNVAVETAKSGKETIQSFLETFKRMPDPKELPHSITAMVQAAGVSVQAVDGFYRGVLGLKLAELTKELGDLQQSEELIQALIKSLEDILKGMEGSLDARGRTMSSLQQDFNALFRANDEIVEKMYRG